MQAVDKQVDERVLNLTKELRLYDLFDAL